MWWWAVLCVFSSHTHTHTHRTDSIWLHTMASQNDRTHSTIYSLSLGTITRYTFWDALQDSSTSHRLFRFPLLLPVSSHSRHVFNYFRLYYILICGFKGQTDTYYKKEIYFLTHLTRGILGFALFIHLSDSVSTLAISALQWPNRTSLMLSQAWLHHAWSSMIHSGKYSLWGCIQRDSGRDSLKDLKSDLPDYITAYWMSTL